MGFRISLCLVFLGMLLFSSPAKGFEIVSHVNGERVWAGTTVTLKIDMGETSPLLGVLFLSAIGGSASKVDSLIPFEWTVTIPKNYHGPLTFRAIGRRFYPIANPPRASVTLEVVRPLFEPVSQRIQIP